MVMEVSIGIREIWHRIFVSRDEGSTIQNPMLRVVRAVNDGIFDGRGNNSPRSTVQESIWETHRYGRFCRLVIHKNNIPYSLRSATISEEYMMSRSMPRMRTAEERQRDDNRDSTRVSPSSLTSPRNPNRSSGPFYGGAR